MKRKQNGFRRAVLAAMLFTGVSSMANAVTCPTTVSDADFASKEKIIELSRKVVNFGLRSTASPAHEANISWIESELLKLPGMTTKSEPYELQRWTPKPLVPAGNFDLETAATLKVGGSAVNIAGVIPYSLPTGAQGMSGQLVYIPTGTPITSANARGKVVIRDIQKGGMPYSLFYFVSSYMSSDFIPDMLDTYTRPFMNTDGQHSDDLIDAGKAGAAGVISVFDVPRKYARGYWDPHHGYHYTVPAVYVGVDEGEALKQAATSGATANIAVLAERDVAMTRNLIGTLPGMSAERVILSTHTDGIGYVEENGEVALLALADYFARLPKECRTRTLQFAFGTAHMHIAKEGTMRIAERLNKEYASGTIAYAMALEHLGTREILPVPRTDGGPGTDLAYTGKSEASVWFAVTDPLKNALTNALKARNMDRSAVATGFDVPNPFRAPAQCSFGGIGTAFHMQLIPTVGMISGPWSLWAPEFGEGAIDFDRMRTQILAAGDVILATSYTPRSLIAGAYETDRNRRAMGTASTCEEIDKHGVEQAPGPEPL